MRSFQLLPPQKRGPSTASPSRVRSLAPASAQRPSLAEEAEALGHAAQQPRLEQRFANIPLFPDPHTLPSANSDPAAPVAQRAAAPRQNLSPMPPSAWQRSQGQVAQRRKQHEVQKPHRLLQQRTAGLPDRLKAGIENLSGVSMDDVHVHYNSARPARLEALAYTQGTEIYMGPGQERHLGHEAWHAVQQKRGRVRPTLQVAATPVNDERSLETEAHLMGAKAVAQSNGGQAHSQTIDAAAPTQAGPGSSAVAQRVIGKDGDGKAVVDKRTGKRYTAYTSAEQENTYYLISSDNELIQSVSADDDNYDRAQPLPPQQNNPISNLPSQYPAQQNPPFYSFSSSQNTFQPPLPFHGFPAQNPFQQPYYPLHGFPSSQYPSQQTYPSYTFPQPYYPSYQQEQTTGKDQEVIDQPPVFETITNSTAPALETTTSNASPELETDASIQEAILQSIGDLRAAHSSAKEEAENERVILSSARIYVNGRLAARTGQHASGQGTHDQFGTGIPRNERQVSQSDAEVPVLNEIDDLLVGIKQDFHQEQDTQNLTPVEQNEAEAAHFGTIQIEFTGVHGPCHECDQRIQNFVDQFDQRDDYPLCNNLIVHANYTQPPHEATRGRSEIRSFYGRPGQQSIRANNGTRYYQQSYRSGGMVPPLPNFNTPPPSTSRARSRTTSRDEQRRPYQSSTRRERSRSPYRHAPYRRRSFPPRVDSYRPRSSRSQVDSYRPNYARSRVDSYRPRYSRPQVDSYRPRSSQSQVDSYRPRYSRPQVDSYRPRSSQSQVDSYPRRRPTTDAPTRREWRRSFNSSTRSKRSRSPYRDRNDRNKRRRYRSRSRSR